MSNQRLLTYKLPDPDPPVQALLKQFDDFLDVEKFAVLPVLETLFRKPTRIPEHDLSSDLGEWLEAIFALSERQQRSAAIWLSRYCANPDDVIPVLVSAPPSPGSSVANQSLINHANASSTTGPGIVNSGIVNSETVDSEAVDSEAVDSEAVDSEAVTNGAGNDPVHTFDPNSDRRTIWRGSAAIDSSVQLGAGAMAAGAGAAAANTTPQSRGNGSGAIGLRFALGTIWRIISFLLRLVG